MTFKQETGALIDQNDNIISIFDGEPGHVDFPDALIAKLHKMNPGYIQRFTHVHPPGVETYSGQDFKMMKINAFVMHPFPVRLGVISQRVKIGEEYLFEENVYIGMLEPLELWDKTRPRGFEVRLDNIIKHRVRPGREYSHWSNWLVERSYEQYSK